VKALGTARSEERSTNRRIGVLFVCAGNICRSPLAEGVFSALADRAGLRDRVVVDSAGTHGSQVGRSPDPRVLYAARRRGYVLPPHVARQIVTADFARYDWILAMDRHNLAMLEAMRPTDFRGHLGLLLALSDQSNVLEVPDPYYGGTREFEHALALVETGAAALLEAIRLHLAIEARAS
jgi:protein-tyrosine phosphatase